MTITIISYTIIKISIFNIRISSIKCLLKKSYININNYKTNKVGPYDRNNEIIGNKKYTFILFYRFNNRAIIKTNILYVRIGIESIK